MYCLRVIPLHFQCVQCEGVVLQQVDSRQHVMLLVQVGHVNLVCGPELVSMSPGSAGRVHRASNPIAFVAAAHGLLAEKK